MTAPGHPSPDTPWRRVLVVVAHPDDESFALGALIDREVARGAEVAVLCLTRGEASTLGATSRDLAALRESELAEAARELGCARTTLLDHPDGALAAVDGAVLERDVEAEVARTRPDGILVFDPEGGVTGHPDHRAASLATLAVAARHDLPVLGWALPVSVSDALNVAFGAAFVGYADDELEAVVVDRTRQLRAVRRHASQAVPGSVLWRRLELLGDVEHVRPLRRAGRVPGP
ncbi:PIG-L family deacetylase [Fodinibacter luteus]|uniref:PIG-L family deacetylase n=1 Tax=Fodinibacter luteus TaxID=552064 RepID=A0ABP8JXX9_9MICO